MKYRLRADPVVWVTLVFLAAVGAIHLLAAPERRDLFEETVAGPLFLGLMLLAILFRPDPGSAPSGERRFWNWLAAGFGCWLLVPLYQLVIPPEADGIRLWILEDGLYLLFYAALIFAVEARQRPEAGGAVEDPRRWFSSAGAVVFVFALLIYFVVIPGWYASEQYSTFVPSVFLLIVLDLYLVVRFGSAAFADQDRRFRSILGLLAATSFIWAVSDALELFYLLGWIDYATLSAWPVVWYLPNLLVLAATRIPERASAPAARRPLGLWAGVGPIVLYALLLPVLHLAAYSTGLLDESVRSARAWMVLASLPVLGVLAWVEQRVLEKSNRQLHEELTRAGEALQQARRMESVSRLAGGVAHDFNNLLTVIQGTTDFVEAGWNQRREVGRHLETIREAADRGNTLVRQLLALGRRKPLAPGSVDPNRMVSEIDGLIRSALGAGIDYRARLAPAVPSIRADRDELVRVMINLAVNSRDAMPSGGSFEIETRLVDSASPGVADRVAFIVRDSGVGMDDETRDQIFEPFFTTKGGERGSGMGLATAHSVITQSGGELRVDSAPGNGTEFTILLPADRSARAEVDSPRRNPIEAEERTRTVMLVDDDEGVRELLREMLIESGYRVHTADNGRSALERMQRDSLRVDLLLTDVMMPEMDGAELAEQVSRRWPDTAILFMSGYVERSDPRLEAAYRAGAFLEKPFRLESALTRISEVLAESSQSPVASRAETSAEQARARFG